VGRLITSADILEAATRVAPYVRHTDLVISEPMSERSGATIAIKAEHQQHTGSFKLRGALNKILTLDGAGPTVGVTAASSGNHGIAVATAAAIKGLPCTVYLPSRVPPTKLAAIRRAGAEIVVVDSTDAAVAEQAARAAATTTGAVYVSPYNDAHVIAGQGTIAVEIGQDARAAGLDRIDAVVVAVGGGGLISGIATWFKHWSPSTRVIGASPSNDHAMVSTVARRAGRGARLATWSDATAGGVEADAITIPLCRTLVDTWITVSEPEIGAAVVSMLDDHHQLVGGAAGVALGAAQRHARSHPSSSIVAVSCGANISSSTLRQMIDG
jgi:threonine dehydratase